MVNVEDPPSVRNTTVGLCPCVGNDRQRDERAVADYEPAGVLRRVLMILGGSRDASTEGIHA